MSKVLEFMNTNVLSVSPEDKLEKVMNLFKEKGINGLPVVDADKKVVGIITARDLLKHSEKVNIVPLPYFPEWGAPYDYMLDTVAYKKSAEEFLATDVQEVMSKRVYTLHEYNTWHEAASYMKKKDVNRLPVVDDEGKLKGIVTRNDLLNFMSEHDVD